jgi:hypothetical protein
VPQVGNDLFLHNMRALWRVDPHLALRVDAVDDDERFPLEPTRNGAWTTRIPGPDGQPAYVHSRYDPQAEAEKFADAITIEDKFCFVLSGLGLGYHLLALFERLRGDVIVVCVEPSIRMIATALTCVDLAGLIEAQRLIFLTDTEKYRLHDRLQPYNALIMLGAQFVRHAPSARLYETEHAAVTEAIGEFVTYSRMTLMTLMVNSRITCKNIAMNLVHYVTTPPIDLLHRRYVGKPAIVVSAGPSLSKNIDQLKELQGHAVLIAVQTALRPLMQRDITPDFVTSLDYHEMSRKFFEGVGDLSNVHLVAEPKATWHVIDRYPGPVSLLDNGWARLVLGDALAARGGLRAGATVAHLAFYLAVYMGCDPIIFVGQDLAFTGHVYYTPGVEIHQAWRGELNRFNWIEQKEWERIARHRPILRKVAGIEGSTLYTDELLFTYLEQFEKDIAEAPARVIQCTEGGARIRGTEAMPLCDAARLFARDSRRPETTGAQPSGKPEPQASACANAPPPGPHAVGRAMPAVPASHEPTKTVTFQRDWSKLAPARAELKKRISELDRVVTTCDELLDILNELKGLTDKPNIFNRKLLRVDELRARIQAESRAYQIVNMATQAAEFRRFKADRYLSTAEADDAERARRQLARDTEFISAVKEGAETVKPILADALERIDKARERA